MRKYPQAMLSMGWPLAGLLLMATGGCQDESVSMVPAGPGVATQADLRPWTASASDTTQFGCLMQFNVASTLGNYVTWGLDTPVALHSMEVDVRACAAAAEDFRGRTVIIHGKMLPREDNHFPLLVADQIIPADEHGKALPDTAMHIAMAQELDPATHQLDPLVDFQPVEGVVTASAN
jgi:hypothetical protein